MEGSSVAADRFRPVLVGALWATSGSSLVGPGAVATELPEHNRPEIQEVIRGVFKDVEPLRSEDIAAGILYALASPANVAVNELLIRPARQVR